MHDINITLVECSTCDEQMFVSDVKWGTTFVHVHVTCINDHTIILAIEARNTPAPPVTMMSAVDVNREYGIPLSTARNWFASGKIPAQKERGQWKALSSAILPEVERWRKGWGEK